MSAPAAHAVGFVVAPITPRVIGGVERCGIADCDPPVYRRGYCGKHFMEAWRFGMVRSGPVSLACRVCGGEFDSKPGGRKFCSPQCFALHRRYRMTPDVHGALRAALACQACALPGTYGGHGSGSLHVDHDHASGMIRGFLDPGCNQALGLAGDSPLVLRRLAGYLRSVEGMDVDALPALIDSGCCEMCGRPKKVQARRSGRAVRYCHDPRCANYASRLRAGFQMEPGQYRWLVTTQGSCCAGCLLDLDNGKRTAVDHCHRTGAIRGVMHSSCNMAIGAVAESPERLEALAAYLERQGPVPGLDDAAVDEVA